MPEMTVIIHKTFTSTPSGYQGDIPKNYSILFRVLYEGEHILVRDNDDESIYYIHHEWSENLCAVAQAEILHIFPPRTSVSKAVSTLIQFLGL